MCDFTSLRVSSTIMYIHYTISIETTNQVTVEWMRGQKEEKERGEPGPPIRSYQTEALGD